MPNSNSNSNSSPLHSRPCSSPIPRPSPPYLPPSLLSPTPPSDKPPKLPLFGPGSKKLSLSHPLPISPSHLGIPSPSHPIPIPNPIPNPNLNPNPNIMLNQSCSLPPIDPVLNPPLQTPLIISSSSDDSSDDDDDDDEAIADALLGRSVNSKLLIGRVRHLQVPPRITKEDGELSEDDPSRSSPRSAPLLTRLDHDPTRKHLPPKPSSATPQAHLLSLPDRPNIPTGPRRQARRNGANDSEHLDRPQNPYSASERALPSYSSSTRASSDGTTLHQIAYLHPTRSPRQSLSCSTNSLTSTAGGSMDSIDKLIHAMSQPDSLNTSARLLATAHPHSRRSSQDVHFLDNTRSTNPQPHVKSMNLDVCLPLNNRINSSGASKDASLDTRDLRVGPDGRLEADEQALLGRIGSQPHKLDTCPPQPPPISSQVLPGPSGLRDRLLSPNSASLISASSSGRSLLERTDHLPPPPPPPPAPEGWSETSVPEGSRRNERSQFGDRGMSSRSQNDRRRAPYIPQHPRRYCASRSRSPPRRNRYSPPASSAGSRGPASISPRAKFFRRRSSRSPPAQRRKSPSSGDVRPKRPFRKTSPGPYFGNNRRNTRDSSPKFTSSQFQHGHHHHHRRNPHVSNSAGGFHGHYRNQTQAETMKSSGPDLLANPDVESGKTPKVSVLIANLPSHPILTPKCLYEHSVQFLYNDESDPALPFELTLYRFAGTTRVCGELKFKTEAHARHFAKKAARAWPAQWYASAPPPPKDAEQNMEFTVVERDRTPWPSRYDTYNPSVSLDCENSTAVDEVRPINTSTGVNVSQDQPDSQKEVGPPTPTSFKSQAPPSRSPANETSLTPAFAVACTLTNSPRPLLADDLPNPSDVNQRPNGDELTGVLLSDLKPCVSMSVLLGHFVVPTRPRHFRMFEPLKVTQGPFTTSNTHTTTSTKGTHDSVNQDSGMMKSGCLITFEDALTASNFSRVLHENAPFEPMRIELVNAQDIQFSPSASIISSQPSRMRGGPGGQYQQGNPERDNRGLEEHWHGYGRDPATLSPTTMEISRIVEMAEQQQQQQAYGPSGLGHGEMGCYGPGSYAEHYQMSLYGPVQHHPPSPLLFGGVYPPQQQTGWENREQSPAGSMGETHMNGHNPCRADQLRQALLARRAGHNVYQDR